MKARAPSRALLRRRVGLLVAVHILVGASAAEAAALPLPCPGCWSPAPATSWQMQLQGPADLSVAAEAFVLDGFRTKAEVVAQIHAAGARAVCHVSAGVWERGRPDARRFPPTLLGRGTGRPGERWLNIRRLRLLSPLVKARFALCRRKGFDSVAPDDVAGYRHHTGFSLTARQQLRYNRWLANQAHRLGLSVALRNDLEQVRGLLPYFDFAIAEECFRRRTCNKLLPFVDAGKAIFEIEYRLETSAFCPSAAHLGFSAIRKRPRLDAYRHACPPPAPITSPTGPPVETPTIPVETWTIPFETWVTGGPVNPTTATSASFAFSASEGGATFQCRLDGSAWTACASPAGYSGLVAGRHRFEVRGFDAVGNRDATPALYAWDVGLAASDVAAAGRVRPWAPQFMGASGLPTATQATADARNFGLLLAHAPAYRDHVAAMKAANPSLQLMVYLNATTSYRSDLPESAYAHDSAGNRITPLEWTDTYLLNPGSPYIASLKKSEATQLLAESGYDGLYLDATGTAALKLTYVTALPINPATGNVWTPSDWLAGVRDNIVTPVKSVVLPRPVYINSLKDGPAYWDASAPRWTTLTPGIKGSVAETWLRESAAAITKYPSETVWKQNVDLLVDAGARGYGVLQSTKVWTTATTAEKDAWYEYTLASFLLGNDGRSRFFFSYAPGDSTLDRPWNHLALGGASGPYAKTSGAYQRSFSAGRVLVNPTTATVAVALGGVYRTLTGASVTSVTLPPNSGKILLR